MKNITLSADDRLIEIAREEALLRKTTLNQLFRDWLADLAERREHARHSELAALTQRLSYVEAGRKFSREEMNER